MAEADFKLSLSITIVYPCFLLDYLAHQLLEFGAPAESINACLWVRGSIQFQGNHS